MNEWPSTRARRVLAALERIGWRIKRQRGSHKVLEHDGCPDYVFAFQAAAPPAPTPGARG